MHFRSSTIVQIALYRKLLFSLIKNSNTIDMSMSGRAKAIITVRPNTVAGKAGHVRLERPIDSSSDKSVCAPKVAEKSPYTGGLQRRLDQKAPDRSRFLFLSSTRSAIFPGNMGNSCGISCFLRPKFTDHIPQFMPLITRRHYVTLHTYGRAHSVKG